MDGINHSEAMKLRATTESLAAEAQLIAASPAIAALMDATPICLLILNQHRQAVFANQHALKLLQWTAQDALGKRPGELFHCVHAVEGGHGCGSSEACTVCGAAHVIQASQLGATSVSECHIHGRDVTESMDLRVSTSPIQLDGAEFILVTLQDISHEHRRRNLERIFFHDLLNSVGALTGYAQLLDGAGPDEMDGLRASILAMADNLAEEVRAQSDLLAAENGALQLRIEQANSRDVIERLVAQYRSHSISRGRGIVIGRDLAAIDFRTDLRLLRRILGNMLKNALEATHIGDSVTVTCEASGSEQLIFSVSNPQWIDRDTQLRIFHRAFSTKGTGRGLGTYSMKLLGEKYLKGEVHFHSTPSTGTTFSLIISAEPR